MSTHRFPFLVRLLCACAYSEAAAPIESERPARIALVAHRASFRYIAEPSYAALRAACEAAHQTSVAYSLRMWGNVEAAQRFEARSDHSCTVLESLGLTDEGI